MRRRQPESLVKGELTAPACRIRRPWDGMVLVTKRRKIAQTKRSIVMENGTNEACHSAERLLLRHLQRSAISHWSSQSKPVGNSKGLGKVTHTFWRTGAVLWRSAPSLTDYPNQNRSETRKVREKYARFFEDGTVIGTQALSRASTQEYCATPRAPREAW